MIALTVALAAFASLIASGVAAAQTTTTTVVPTRSEPAGGPTTNVIEATAYIDPIVAGFIIDRVDAAATDGAAALVIQLNSPGVLLDDDTLAELIEALDTAEVPVAVWVGPAGATARGGATVLVDHADVTGIAPGSSIDVGDPAERRRLGADDAVASGAIDRAAPTLGDFVVGLDGVEWADARAQRTGAAVAGEPIDTARVVVTDAGPRLEPHGVRFAKLNLVDRLFHTVASPQVAYLLLATAIVLLLFDLFTGGVGVAGGTGAVCLVLAASGLSVLPTNPAALGLFVVAAFGFGVDIQTGVPRFWTVVGGLAFVTGSLTLYDGVSLSWLTLLVGVAGTVVMVLNATPAVVRSRYSTPTIGREWMVGELARVTSALDPDGEVTIRGATWRARTNRATPIDVGDDARVTGLSGVVLEVEPLEGAARDYRERARSGDGPDGQ